MKAATPRRLVLIGSGGHALEVVQLIEDINASGPTPAWEFLGCLVESDAAGSPQRPNPLPVLGGLEWLQQHAEVSVVLAFGSVGARLRLMSDLPGLAQSPLLVHPRAWVASRASLGAGTVVFAGACINAGVSIGAHSIINLNCTVSHDCVIGDACSLGPGCHLAGGVQVEAGCDFGVGSSARPRSHVGAGCVVGAGATVIGDLAPGCVAVGVPARPIRQRA